MGSETSGKGFINSGRRAEISHKTAFFVVPLPLKDEVHELDKIAYGLAANGLLQI